MIYFNLVIIVASAVLAIISRKHYSKYKDGQGIKAAVKAVVMSIGQSVWIFIVNVLPLDGLRSNLREQLRKNQVVSDKELELITDRFLAGCVGVACGIIATSNLLEFGSTLTRNLLRNDRDVIIRNEYGGDVVEEEISCQISGQEEIVIMEVSPVRLSQEEFHEKADQVAESVIHDITGEGNIISQDIQLPLSDEEGVFDISWVSQTPNVISSRGRINTPLSETPLEARLTMYILYYGYSAEYELKLMVGTGQRSEAELRLDGLKQDLYNLEQENLDKREFVLPESIGDVELKLKRNDGSKGRFLIIGAFVAVGVVGAAISRLKEAGQKRDRWLMKEYPYFVDSLWLYIEAGMNIRRAMKQYVNAAEDSLLAEELRYTLNQIDNGQAEYVSYEELGSRLNLPVYVSLMRHISQNLKMGTKDLRVLMEAEVTMALDAKRETAKRLGEEASTKLVLPMIILLVVVMIMIMTPAFMGF